MQTNGVGSVTQNSEHRTDTVMVRVPDQEQLVGGGCGNRFAIIIKSSMCHRWIASNRRHADELKIIESATDTMGSPIMRHLLSKDTQQTVKYNGRAPSANYRDLSLR